MKHIVSLSEVRTAIESAVRENSVGRRLEVSILDDDITVGTVDVYDEFHRFIETDYDYYLGKSIRVIDQVDGRMILLIQALDADEEHVVFEASDMIGIFHCEKKDMAAVAIKDRFMDSIGRQYFLEY